MMNPKKNAFRISATLIAWLSLIVSAHAALDPAPIGLAPETSLNGSLSALTILKTARMNIANKNGKATPASSIQVASGCATIFACGGGHGGSIYGNPNRPVGPGESADISVRAWRRKGITGGPANRPAGPGERADILIHAWRSRSAYPKRK